jgi:SWI/SNF-related matrix-associated actin-dependent regulator 1 of chromatin subfamily A
MSKKLFEHQKSGIEFFKEIKTAGILADEMGLGKTIQAIIGVRELTNKTILVVCPASLKINWEREIKDVYDNQEVRIVKDGKSNIWDKLLIYNEWIIINYDILKKHKDNILSLVDKGIIEAAIMDESHYIKGQSVRAKTTIDITKDIKIVFGLTGTPILNRPIELWNQLLSIGHPITKEINRTYYSKRYCGGRLKTIYLKNRFGGVITRRFWWENGATNLDELRKKISGSILRRKKKDVLGLPPKIITTLEIQLDPNFKEQYNNAWEEYLKFLKDNPPENTTIDNIIMARHLVEIQKLKQICSQAKIKRVISDILNAVDQEQKVVVFSQYVNTIKTIKEELSRKNIKSVILMGDTKMEERQKAVDDFQRDPEVKVFIGNIKAAGVGITLTEASIVKFIDMDWSPEVHSQAEDRTHRIGQNGTVNVYYYICLDTIEEYIIKLLLQKKVIVQNIIDGENKTAKSGTILKEFMKRMSEIATDKNIDYEN